MSEQQDQRDQQDGAAASRRAESTARQRQSVDVLLEHRSDLEGVVPMVDLIRDAVHWAA